VLLSINTLLAPEGSAWVHMLWAKWWEPLSLLLTAQVWMWQLVAPLSLSGSAYQWARRWHWTPQSAMMEAESPRVVLQPSKQAWLLVAGVWVALPAAPHARTRRQR
jgi:hypothetical protein